MSDDDGHGAAIGEHFGGNLSGEGAARLDVAILSTDTDTRSERFLGSEINKGCGRTDDEFASVAQPRVISARHLRDLVQ